jgi:NAD-dependent dihydropyrimidine dehydrogenase PreA subunit
MEAAVHANIPREKVNWQPTINYDARVGDRLCSNFCRNDVFPWEQDSGQPTVKNPLNCVIGRDRCARQRPVEAITFPSKEKQRTQPREWPAQLQQATVRARPDCACFSSRRTKENSVER